MLFSKGLFGYKPNEVDKHLADMEDDYNKKLLELKAVITDFMQINERLKVELERANSQLYSYQKAEKAVAEALIKAQIRAEAIEEDAMKKADEMRKEVEMELVAKKKKLEEMQTNYAKAKNEFEQIINKYLIAINELDNYELTAEDS